MKKFEHLHLSLFSVASLLLVLQLSFQACTTTTSDDRLGSSGSAPVSLAPNPTGLQMDLAESFDDASSVSRISSYRILDLPEVGSFYLPAGILKEVRQKWMIAKVKLKTNPNHARALRVLATYELTMGNGAGAKTYIEISRTLQGAGGAGRRGFDPGSSLVLALAFLSLGDARAARKEFARAEASTAGHSLSLINQGLYSLSQGNAQTASGHFQEALVRDPKNVIALLHLGQSHYLTRRFDMALRAFDRALELDPENSLALFNKGIVLHRGLRQYTKARSSLETIVKSETSSENMKKKASGALVNLDRDEQGTDNLATIGIY